MMQELKMVQMDWAEQLQWHIGQHLLTTPLTMVTGGEYMKMVMLVYMAKTCGLTKPEIFLLAFALASLSKEVRYELL